MYRKHEIKRSTVTFCHRLSRVAGHIRHHKWVTEAERGESIVRLVAIWTTQVMMIVFRQFRVQRCIMGLLVRTSRLNINRTTDEAINKTPVFTISCDFIDDVNDCNNASLNEFLLTGMCCHVAHACIWLKNPAYCRQHYA